MTISNVGALPVSVLAADVVATIPANANVRELAKALTAADVGALAIVNGEDVCGIVSERDVVRALAANRDPDSTTAGDIAQTRLVWCDAESTVAAVAEEMMDHYVRHVLVEEDGRLRGMVSARDLLGAYAAIEVAEDA